MSFQEPTWTAAIGVARPTTGGGTAPSGRPERCDRAKRPRPRRLRTPQGKDGLAMRLTVLGNRLALAAAYEAAGQLDAARMKLERQKAQLDEMYLEDEE